MKEEKIQREKSRDTVIDASAYLNSVILRREKKYAK